MPRVKAAVSGARELAVLACVRSHLEGSEGAVASIARVARETGLSSCQARAALQRLARKGALVATPRARPDGASAANSYRITRAGLALLGAAGPEERPPQGQSGPDPAQSAPPENGQGRPPQRKGNVS